MRYTAFIVGCFLSAGLSAFGKLKVYAAGVCTPVPQASEIGDRATCPFTMAIDADLHRIPAELPVVKCNCAGSVCSDRGDFRCQEVRSTFKVAYRTGAGSTDSGLTDGTVDLTTSCVCVVSKSSVAVTGGVRTQDLGKFGKPPLLK